MTDNDKKAEQHQEEQRKAQAQRDGGEASKAIREQKKRDREK